MNAAAHRPKRHSQFISFPNCLKTQPIAIGKPRHVMLARTGLEGLDDAVFDLRRSIGGVTIANRQ